MAKTPRVSKDTGLLYGDYSKIARIHRCTPHHVRYVALGTRNGRPALLDTIRRYQQKAAEAIQQSSVSAA